MKGMRNFLEMTSNEELHAVKRIEVLVTISVLNLIRSIWVSHRIHFDSCCKILIQFLQDIENKILWSKLSLSNLKCKCRVLEIFSRVFQQVTNIRQSLQSSRCKMKFVEFLESWIDLATLWSMRKVKIRSILNNLYIVHLQYHLL